MLVKMSLNFFIFSLFLTVSSQTTAEILTVYTTSNNNAPSLAVSVNNQDLTEVSNSILMAETWLRNHVLPFYPSYNITHIVVGHNLLCSSNFHHLFLPSLKNLHHSLIRWGLSTDIKVSPSFSSHCFENSPDFSPSKNVINFINSTNSSYMINPSTEFTDSSNYNIKFETLVNNHMKFLKKFGFLTSEKSLNFMVVLSPLSSSKPTTMRKLSYILPTPSPEELPYAKGPGSLPPLVGVGPTISPPSPTSPNPHLGISPTYPPHPHHHHHNLPPCNPYPAPPQAAPSPGIGTGMEPRREQLWCVAKPSVPAETLQEAMDYACGVGGAECDEIQPNGSCYFPDTIVAHASYAFNSYWQKNKISGGTCSFGGTAMLINSDPSFLQCRFIVS